MLTWILIAWAVGAVLSMVGLGVWVGFTDAKISIKRAMIAAVFWPVVAALVALEVASKSAVIVGMVIGMLARDRGKASSNG